MICFRLNLIESLFLYRRARKTLTTVDLRRSARKPCRQLNSSYYIALSKTLAIPFASLPPQLQIQPVSQPMEISGVTTKVTPSMFNSNDHIQVSVQFGPNEKISFNFFQL